MFRSVQDQKSHLPEIKDELDSLLRSENEIKNEIATYELLIKEPDYAKTLQQTLADSKAMLAKIQSTIAEKTTLENVEQKSAAIDYYNPKERRVRAEPVYLFTDDEQKLMTKYINTGDDLDDEATRPLLEATIMDEATLELTFFPGSVITEGLINWSFKWLTEEYFKIPHPFVDRNDPSNKPHPVFQKTPMLDLPCTKDDVLPCNTLLLALKLLLEKAKRWEKGDKKEPAVPELKKPAEKRKYTSLTEQEVADLEKIYQCLPASRQLMFNCIVRDRTDQIINKAVQLPDGYVYDESIVEKLLKQISPPNKFPVIYEGHCPNNQKITFKVVKDENGKDIYSEIKPVAYYEKVVKLLKANAAVFEKVVRQEGKIALHDDDLSNERDMMIFKLTKFLEKITKTPIMKTEKEKVNIKLAAIKEAQIAVIQAAIDALNYAEAKKFEETEKLHSSIYATVKTKLNGFNDGKSAGSKFYRGIAYVTGTIDGQFGVMMPTIVEKVRDLLERCEKDINLQQGPRRRN